ncbi:hypothetical protein CRE_17417 [Caenorhabditis remanei]|uniref:DUF38 domain-containing protein n=1 Tax=Caenorhabditis remanei TaxID=31234 RepID=E3N292_CAERE|nr:hypothetical protein CRE_17417 [Caenorhabditis remanei]
MDKPLSYDSLKSVLKHMSLKKREQIDYILPSLTTANSKFPYHLSKVTIGDCHFKVNNRTWDVHPAFQKMNEPLTAEDVAAVEFVEIKGRASIRFLVKHQINRHKDLHRYAYDQEINQDNEELFKKLIDEYLKNNTRIDTLNIYSFPKCLEDKNPETWQLKVSEFKFRNTDYATYQKIRPFILGSLPLKRLCFCFRGDTLPMFDDPLSTISISSTTYLSHAVTIPIDDVSELVISGAKFDTYWPPFQWNLKMEVMPIGATVPK